jgi:acetyl esterase/lipase
MIHSKRYSFWLPAVITVFFIGSCSKNDDAIAPTIEAPVAERYQDEVFNSVTVTTVPFTANMDLLMDIYQPQGDSLTARPLIVFAHGGAFIDGSRGLPDMVRLCETFARKGYVTASFSYRLGSGLQLLNDSSALLDVVVRAIHDGKAATRFFRKSVVELDNIYGIDTNIIIGAGNSAGAILMAHLAYLDHPAAMEPHILQALQNEGGLEGNRGNAGYSSKVHAVVNLAGALNRADFIQSGGVPLVSVHGDVDPVVPFGCGPIFSNFPPLDQRIRLCGSESMHAQALAVGIRSELFVFPGAGHCPWISGNGTPTPVMDEVEKFVGDFLFATFFN